MLIVEPLILLQYKPAEMVGKPLRISDGEPGLADHGSAGVSDLPGGGEGGDGQEVEQAVPNLE